MIILLFVNYAKYVEKKTKSIKIRTKTDNSKEGKNKKTNRKDDKIIKINVKKLISLLYILIFLDSL